MIAWLAGKNVPGIEKLDDTEIKSGVMYALRHFLGKFFTIPEPVTMIR